MKTNKEYRHELKYFINETGRFELANRLKYTMDRDPNVGRDGCYHIRSLYFDDARESAMYEKLSGVYERRKYRLRIYNLRGDDAMLECKEKRGPYIHKRSARLSRSAAESLITGRGIPALEREDPLCREVHLRTQTDGLRPAVIVDYLREPFIAPVENLRVTFDRMLQCGLDHRSLFDPNLPTMAVLEGGMSILEIKFNRYLPAYYRDLIGGIRAERSAASKYTLCRGLL